MVNAGSKDDKNHRKISPFFDFQTPKNDNKKPGIALVRS